jgi:dolichol-phosphate mannosyltransferase
MRNKLWVVMPVYNEEKCIEYVLSEWIDKLESLKIEYNFCVINDGSKDQTLSKLKSFKTDFPKIHIIDKENTGHGQSCITGYKYAIEQGAEWIFQIDSDGQCDTNYFDSFFYNENTSSIFGYRKTRDDGIKRLIISKFVTLFVFFATKTYVKDSNVPYRMMSAKELNKIINKVPTDFYLANILIAVLLKRESKINWVTIHFKNRIAGTPSVKAFSFVKHGVKLFKQLKNSIK